MKKKWKTIIVGSAVTVTVGLYSGIKYFYNYAFTRGEKNFITDSDASGGEVTKPKPYKDWSFLQEKPKTWIMTSKDKEKLKLKAVYLANPVAEQKPTPKVMVLVHGYTSKGILLEQYAKMFYNMGYSVLIPDLRGHGESEGDYIGFGWPDRLDVIDWTKKVVQYYHGNVEIGLWGVSMGGATVMMASGEKDLPKQVKVLIEDCGYTSTKEELEYQLKQQFNLPSFPIEPLTSAYVNYRDNYNFEESDAIKQLHKNKRPILFIHGKEDKFVPYFMLKKCAEATRGPKEIYSVPGAGHAKSFKVNPQKYQEVVTAFLNKYMN